MKSNVIFTPSPPLALHGPHCKSPTCGRWRHPGQRGSSLAHGHHGHFGVGCLGDAQQARLTEVSFLFSLLQGRLLSISAAYGDLETVRYLLTERQVQLPTEPTDDNAAVVAAHFGHTDVAHELLESLPGKARGESSSPPPGGPPLSSESGTWGAAPQNACHFTRLPITSSAGNTTPHTPLPPPHEVGPKQYGSMCFFLINRLYLLKQF